MRGPGFVKQMMCAFVLMLLGQGAFAQVYELPFEVSADKEDEFFVDPYYSVARVKLERLADEEMVVPFLNENEKSLGEVIMVVDQLIAIGEKIWPIIEAGRPVLTTALTPVRVLPSEVLEDENLVLERWSAPRVARYRVVYENLYGMDVITFTFSVQFQSGGQLEGKGRYLDGVYVAADNVSVSWGFNFDAKTIVTAITNRGTAADPVAGLTLRLEYVAKSVFREIKSTASFHVTGNGTFQKL